MSYPNQKTFNSTSSDNCEDLAGYVLELADKQNKTDLEIIQILIKEFDRDDVLEVIAYAHDILRK